MATRSTTSAPPLSVGRYELSGRVGVGRTSTLFRAREIETGAPAAVQLIPGDLHKEPGLFERLHTTFQAALPLDHPNIVRLVDFGRESGYWFVATEWIEGTTLSQMIQAHTRISEEIAIRVVTQIGQAIDFLLAGEFASYRVRTTKIVIRNDGVAKLVTFSPARGCIPSSPMPGVPTAAASPLDSTLIDPAQSRLEDPVYALATVLFECVTGREWVRDEPQPEAAPGRSSSRRRRSSATLMRPPGLSERVELAVRRATDRDPDKRPGSCAEFLKLLYHRPRAGGAKADSRPAATDADNRREHVRYALGVGSSGTIHDSVFGSPLDDGPKSQEVWPLVVRDVSAGGVGLLLARRCEVGTELLIEMVMGPNRVPRTLAVRVVRVKRENHGHWAHGCQFLRQLTEEELASLLDHVGRTA
jgi:serine/threonine protein kinase